MRAPLEQLHDFYQPAPPSWHPQTLGAYVTLCILAILLIALAAFLWHRWKRNSYRREALRDLSQTDVRHISELLKRTALSAWPREQVAALTGSEWLTFLNTSAEQAPFNSTVADEFETMAFSSSKPSREDEKTIRSAASVWIKHHRAPRKGEKHVSA